MTLFINGISMLLKSNDWHKIDITAKIELQKTSKFSFGEKFKKKSQKNISLINFNSIKAYLDGL